MLAKQVQVPFGQVDLADAKLVRPLEGVDSTETSPADRLSVKDLTRVRIDGGRDLRVAVVVRDHDGRIKRLKVHDEERTLVERALRLHDERLTLCCILAADLSHTGKISSEIRDSGGEELRQT